jgi:hypothetical protein
VSSRPLPSRVVVVAQKRPTLSDATSSPLSWASATHADSPEQLFDDFVRVDDLTGSSLRNASAQRVVQPCPLFVVKVVAATGKYFVERHQLHVAVRQIGWLIENDATVANPRSEGLLHGR